MNSRLNKRFYSPEILNTRLKKFILVTGIISLIFLAGSKLIIIEQPLVNYDEMTAAAVKMGEAIDVVKSYCLEFNITINDETDLNRTGLIGPELTGITSSLGHLEAKRSTTNPDMAALIVKLLYDAGVGRGDYIAVGSSASFPALMIAALSAAETIGVNPVMIISLGASNFGATRSDFNLLHIYDLLLEEGVFETRPAAISLGGDLDTGEGFGPDTKNDLIRQIEDSRIPFIFEEDLEKNIAKRMKIIESTASKEYISAFINIGGSYANMGNSFLALNVRPGLNKDLPLPPKEDRGMIFEMASRDIPVIHLLYMRGLVQDYGLAWDPVPFPEPGISSVYYREIHRNPGFILTAFFFFLIMTGSVFIYKHRK